MRIVILTAQIMFVRGGAELLVNNLKHALEERGHEVEVVAIPFNDNPVERIEDRIKMVKSSTETLLPKPFHLWLHTAIRDLIRRVLPPEG